MILNRFYRIDLLRRGDFCKEKEHILFVQEFEGQINIFSCNIYILLCKDIIKYYYLKLTN